MVGGFTALYTQTSSSVLAYSNSYLASRRVRSPPGAVCGSAATVVGVRRPFLRQQTATRVAQQLGEVISDDVGTSTADIQEQLAADQQLAAALEELPAEVPPEALTDFAHELEEDLASVAVTLTAVTGVIIFWRGVWSLLDYFLGDSIFGDICCILLGLAIVLGIRLSGVKVSSSFWPPS